MVSSFVASALAASFLAWTGHVAAQVNLPPPPPPPLGSDSAPSTGTPSSSKKPRSTAAPAGASAPATSRDRSERAERTEVDETPTYRRSYSGRFLSVRANPLALFVGRVSADAEWMFAPHHALIGSPHFVFARKRSDLVARALGFAGDAATGFGVELGYHYFTGDAPLEGLFLGPSLLLDSTRQTPNLPSFASYGVAFDVGYQAIIGNGLTLAAGGGVLVMSTSGQSSYFAPRVLLGVGWTF